MSTLSGKRVVVFGLGQSGVAAARLAMAQGARVVAVDAKSRDALSPEALSLEVEGATLAVGSNDAPALAQADLVVVSPGVPPLPELDRVARAGVLVIGELELAFGQLPTKARVVAVGGTNGKSTTTSLAGELLAAAGHRPFVGGNLGVPLSCGLKGGHDVFVVEVSSFQLERAGVFRPDVGILLNVTADHLDRYPNLDAYARAKGRCFARQTEGDLAVVLHGDALCEREARRGRARLVTFGAGGDVDVREGEIFDRATSAHYDRDAIRLAGGHNALNVAAAIAAVRPFAVEPDAIRAVLARFEGLPHRTALVADEAGVRWYDDSKGTNVGASVTALEMLREPKAVLIAGGRDKGGSYAPLAEALRKKGRAVVVMGEAKDLIARAVGDAVPVHVAASMGEAVALAARAARPGDAVLLSPACSSYDMFENYRERGAAFVRAVRELHAKKGVPA